MPEQVAVMDAGPAAELAHRLAQARLDQRVDHHGRTSARSRDRELEVVDALDARMADLLERLLRKLRLEREHEPRRRLACRVGDDVQLDGLRVCVHGRQGIGWRNGRL